MKKAIVTGASSGIGLAVVRRFLDEGLEVVGLSRRCGAGLEEVPRFRHLPMDLSDADALPARLEELAAQHGDTDALVLNAGRGDFGSLEELSYQRMRALMDLNFLGAAFVARALVPAMKRRGKGCVVFIGSEASYRGARRGSLYCASKFALRGFAQALREEVSRRGVRVCFVSPGMTRTAFYDELDFAPGDDPANYLEADDVAEAVWHAVSSPPSAVIDEIRLSPLKRVVRSKGGR